MFLSSFFYYTLWYQSWWACHEHGNKFPLWSQHFSSHGTQMVHYTLIYGRNLKPFPKWPWSLICLQELCSHTSGCSCHPTFCHIFLWWLIPITLALIKIFPWLHISVTHPLSQIWWHDSHTPRSKRLLNFLVIKRFVKINRLFHCDLFFIKTLKM